MIKPVKKEILNEANKILSNKNKNKYKYFNIEKFSKEFIFNKLLNIKDGLKLSVNTDNDYLRNICNE